MTEKETIALMHRISSYFSFSLEKYKIQEWYKVLSEYDNDEVNKQLDAHLKSEATEAPKLHLLVKHLEKKNERRAKDFVSVCKFCGSKIATNIDLISIKRHEERCRSVQYLKRVYRKYFNREIENEDELYTMDDREFNANYDQVLKKLLTIPTLSESENYCINKYFNKDFDSEDIKNIAVAKEMEE